MEKIKRGQISIEYLILLGFVIFIIISFLGVSLLYSAQIKDRIKFNHVNNFATKIIQSSESVFYAGEPSKVTITLFLPEGVKSIEIQGNQLVFDVTTNSGITKIAYTSNVPIQIQGSISPSQGIKRLQIKAQQSNVLITQY